MSRIHAQLTRNVLSLQALILQACPKLTLAAENCFDELNKPESERVNSKSACLSQTMQIANSQSMRLVSCVVNKMTAVSLNFALAQSKLHTCIFLLQYQ